VAYATWFAKQGEETGLRWRRNAFGKLAFVARYGHVPPSEAATWEIWDLQDFAAALGEMIEAENKPK